MNVNVWDYEFPNAMEKLMATILGGYLGKHKELKEGLVRQGKEMPIIEGSLLASLLDQAVEDHKSLLEKKDPENEIADVREAYLELLPDGKKFVSGMSAEFARFVTDLCR